MSKLFALVAFASAALVSGAAMAHGHSNGGGHSAPPPPPPRHSEPSKPVATVGVGANVGGLLGLGVGAQVGGKSGLLNAAVGVKTPVASLGLDLGALSGGVGGRY